MHQILKISFTIIAMLFLSACIRNPMPPGATSEHPGYSSESYRIVE